MGQLGVQGTSLLALLLSVACGDVDSTCIEGPGGSFTCSSDAPEAELAQDAPLGERLMALRSDLNLGAQGAEVQTVHDYLMSFGYFPNTALADQHHRWVPIVAQRPARSDVYDQHLAAAVSAFQGMYQLEQTGVVDAATRATLQRRRCGHPDGRENDDDVLEKFAYNPGIFRDRQWPSGSVLTWYIQNTSGGVTINQFKTIARRVFPKWLKETHNLTAPETTDPDMNASVVRITFDTLDGSGPAVARGLGPDRGPEAQCPGWLMGQACAGDITFDVWENWSTSTPTPSGAVDVESVLAHEFGHVLGLSHSSRNGAIMQGLINSQRDLGVDDIVATAAMYDKFEKVNTTTRAKDIAVFDDGTATGKAWILTDRPLSDSFQVAEMTSDTTFALDAGSGKAIAVAPNGRPWVVGSSGTVWRKGSLHASSSSDWVAQRTLDGGGTMCATDIAIGNLFGEGLVWAIGCDTRSGGHSIYQYRNSTSSWRKTNNGSAVRIAVSDLGVPWVAANDGSVWWRSTESGLTPSVEVDRGTWQATPTNALANDIGVYPHDYPWIIGKDSAAGGFNIWLYNKQDGITSPSTPARNEWLKVTNGAVAISVGPRARPWVVASDGTIWRMKP